MSTVKFPVNIVAPIRDFLAREESRLKKKRDRLKTEDPFEDTSRVTDNAATDTDAIEQIGHERAEALKKEIDRRLIQIRKALSQIKIGKYGLCERCGKMIDTDRLMIMPEATICVNCERKKER